MHTKHFTNDKRKLACVSCMRFNVCARIIVKVHKYYSIIYVHNQKMYCSYGNKTKSVTYKPQIHQSMKEKHLICILNIKSRFNHEYLWSHFRNAVLTALIRHSESKITAVRSRTFSMCMCVFVCVCVYFTASPLQWHVIEQLRGEVILWGVKINMCYNV